MTTHYEYDILGRTSRISSPGGMEVRYRYDCLDRLEQIRYGNGIRTSYQYDADGSVSHLETRMGSDILLSFRYQYDGNGNRLMKTGTQGPATDGSSALDITYQYDVRGQLLEENRKDAVFRYSYDAVGNRIRKEEETGKDQRVRTEYAYNEKNQLIHTEEFLEDGNRRRNTFTYSKQGSILREETESGISRYFYNSKNQQIRVECADGQIQENRYDAEGLRHEMRENGKLLRFVYQNGELLYEEGGDKETASCHLGAGIEAVRRGQRTYYYHPDEQLSTALITDETGTIKNQYRYDAFGAGLEVSEELPNRIRYTGQQYDGVTEQYYLRARYYNPILGRFLQEDVYQGDGLNLYAYCRNNPVVYYDPSGYDTNGSAKSCIEDNLSPGNMNEDDLTTNHLSDEAVRHSSQGDFTYNPKTGEISKMRAGGHGQENIDILESNNIEYNVVETYPNGVRIGNVPGHKNRFKRFGTGQSWFPEDWGNDKIRDAGNYVVEVNKGTTITDGNPIFAEYEGVKVGVIYTNGKPATVFPDVTKSE